MSRESILSILGLFVILAPFIGLPLKILAWILPILGVLIVIIGLSLWNRNRTKRIRTVAPFDPAETA